MDSSQSLSPDPTSIPTQLAAPATRRTVIAGAGVAAVALGVAACSNDVGNVSVPQPAAASIASGTVLTTTDQVPVGGGVVSGDIVVTQPQAGHYEAFDTTCPHKGCAVAVAGSALACPCHDSHFSMTGAVTRGPADRNLTPVPITVQGNEIKRA